MSQDAYPLCWPAGWPRTPRCERVCGAFKGSLDSVRRALIYEIDLLTLGRNASRFTNRHLIVISTNYPIRRDGELYASAKEPDDPGVAVYFDYKEKPVCFACDKYDRVWKNVRAIQNTIEAMRGIERWGSSQLLDRAFTGFTALPGKTQAGIWDLLDIRTPEMATEEMVIAAWREKARTAHPDAGGSHEAMTALNEAKDIALATIRQRRAA